MGVVNPESTIMQQTDGYWRNLAALLLFKLSKTEGVKIKAEDMIEFQGTGLCMLTHGHHDSIEFRLVTEDEMARLVKFDAEQRASYTGTKQ